MIKYLILLICLLCPFKSWASSIYIDNTLVSDCTGDYSISSRNCTGSDGNAYDTIQEGVDVMSAGDTMYLRGGTYNERAIYIGDWRSGASDAWYTVSSYPGEWAIIDGQHNPQPEDSKDFIFYGTTANGVQGYIKFERLEITGGGYDVGDADYPSAHGGGIQMRGGPFIFKYLYIHHNYGDNNNNCAGLQLQNGTGDTTIEYCFFEGNGQVSGVDRNTSVANLMIFSDYKYESEVVLYDGATGYSTATQSNTIRYNLFKADSGGGNFTTTGFKHKGMQRLTGYTYADQENVADNTPNDDGWETRGDEIHNNIFIDHMVGIEIDQDYTQVHNNILFMKDWSEGPSSAIQGRDQNSSRRGPFKPSIYNNTINADGLFGISLHLVPDSWSGVTPYIKAYTYNNIIQDAKSDYDSEDLSIESDSVTASGGYPFSDLPVSRNYFYDPQDTDLVRIQITNYTKAEIEATDAADTVYSNSYDGENTLYIGTTGATQYTTRSAHVITGATTIANGGIGGNHPYLAGVTIPSYVGAVDPNDTEWVDGVLSMNVAWFTAQDGDNEPSWITPCTLTGIITNNISESDITDGGETIILTLTGDTWHADIGTDCQQTTDLIAGIDSDKAEAAGWDAEVKANLDYTNVVRDSDTQVTITLDDTAHSSYEITESETVTATIPASVLVTSDEAVVASPTFTIGYEAAGSTNMSAGYTAGAPSASYSAQGIAVQ